MTPPIDRDGATAEPRVVVVTGTSSGFGRLTAVSLARRGHTAFATMRDPRGRNREVADDLERLAREEDLRLEVLALDITDDDSVHDALDAAMSRAGRIDVAVNNAAVGNLGVLEGYTLDQVRAIFETNVLGALRVDRAVLPAMRGRGSGLLIHVSSTAGRVVVPYVSPYSASKAALESLAEELSVELADFGVESVLVEPGAYMTEVFGKLVEPADAAVVAAYGERAEAPARLFGALGARLSAPDGPDPQEVADAIVALVEADGPRPLRTVVGTMITDGVAELNEHYAGSKARLLRSLEAA